MKILKLDKVFYNFLHVYDFWLSFFLSIDWGFHLVLFSFSLKDIF